MRYLPNPDSYKRLTTDELRAAFLVENLFQPGALRLELLDLDRAIVGGVVPTDAAIALPNPPELLAEYFCERRELGVLNIGGAGTVTVDGTAHPLGKKDVLYVGRGSRDVSFASDAAAQPARFYLISYLAHARYDTSVVRAADAQGAVIGAAETANRRRVARYVHRDGVRSAQLVMGVTTLEPGSVWNTMPAHTHPRRTEIYLYFDLPADAMLVHLLGEPTETRSLIVRDGEVALSPGWSSHSGCGTTAYSFCWAMGGENQDYADMQPAPIDTLR